MKVRRRIVVRWRHSINNPDEHVVKFACTTDDADKQAVPMLSTEVRGLRSDEYSPLRASRIAQASVLLQLGQGVFVVCGICEREAPLASPFSAASQGIDCACSFRIEKREGLPDRVVLVGAYGSNFDNPDEVWVLSPDATNVNELLSVDPICDTCVQNLITMKLLVMASPLEAK